MSKEELAMQGSPTDRTSTGYVAIHALDPKTQRFIARQAGWETEQDFLFSASSTHRSQNTGDVGVRTAGSTDHR